MMRNPEQTLGTMLDKQSIVYVSSIDEDGFPNTKAMFAPRVREGIRVFYLTTNTSSLRVAQYRVNSKACVYIADKRFFRGAMFKGIMEILEVDVHKELIWKDGDERYYPKGVQDEDYCVLKFTVQTARYYSALRSETIELQ